MARTSKRQQNFSEEMTECANPNCGMIGVKEEFAASKPDLPVLLQYYADTLIRLPIFYCTECVECKICHLPLKTRTYFLYGTDVGRSHLLEGNIAGTFEKRHYVHRNCFNEENGKSQ